MGESGELSLIYKMKNIIYQSFTGEYTNSLDGKNRLNIPAKFRKLLDPVNNKTFVLTRGFDKCLILYPLNGWQEVESQLSQLSSIRTRDRDFIRSITRHASLVSYDAQGRIQIPEKLKTYSKIENEVNIIGVIKKIELWSPKILTKKDDGSSELPKEDFEILANEINF